MYCSQGAKMRCVAVARGWPAASNWRGGLPRRPARQRPGAKAEGISSPARTQRCALLGADPIPSLVVLRILIVSTGGSAAQLNRTAPVP